MRHYDGEVVRDEVTGLTHKRTTKFVTLKDGGFLFSDSLPDGAGSRPFHSSDIGKLTKLTKLALLPPWFLAATHHDSTVLEIVEDKLV